MSTSLAGIMAALDGIAHAVRCGDRDDVDRKIREARAAGVTEDQITDAIRWTATTGGGHTPSPVL